MRVYDEKIERDIHNVVDSMSIEGMILTEDEIERLRQIGYGEITCEQAISDIKKKYQVE